MIIYSPLSKNAYFPCLCCAAYAILLRREVSGLSFRIHHTRALNRRKVAGKVHLERRLGEAKQGVAGIRIQQQIGGGWCLCLWADQEGRDCSESDHLLRCWRCRASESTSKAKSSPNQPIAHSWSEWLKFVDKLPFVLGKKTLFCLCLG